MERKSTKNIEKCHRQIDNLKAILILLENACIENNAEDIAYYRRRYAEQIQKMCAPHLEYAMTDEEDARIKDEIFSTPLLAQAHEFSNY